MREISYFKNKPENSFRIEFMREIKFRGKDYKDNWHYGFFWIAPDNTHFIKEKITDTHYADFKVIPETIGQYTLIKCKNKEELWEGDIIRTEGDLAIVCWQGQGWGKIGYPNSLEQSVWSRWDTSKKMGNIYDDVKLLEKALDKYKKKHSQYIMVMKNGKYIKKYPRMVKSESGQLQATYQDEKPKKVVKK